MSVVVKGRGFPLDIEVLSDGVVRFSLDGNVVGAITSAGLISATTLSGTTLNLAGVSAATMTATTITATTISGTNVRATTLTATTISGSGLTGTSVCATTLCSNTGATSFTYTGGGSAVLGAQTVSANHFLLVKNGSTTVYIPVFNTITTS